MKNYVSSGDIVTLEAPAGGVKSGILTIIGNLVGYPQTDAEAGQKFGLKTLGVYVETVTSADVITAGQAIYRTSTGELTTEIGTDGVIVADALYDVVPEGGVAETHIRLRG